MLKSVNPRCIVARDGGSCTSLCGAGLRDSDPAARLISKPRVDAAAICCLGPFRPGRIRYDQ